MNLDSFIEAHGSSVTLKTVTLADEDTTYGTKSESVSTSTIKVIFGGRARAPKEDDILTRQGIQETGEQKAYFKTTESIKEGDYITWNSSDWMIVAISKWELAGTTWYQRAGLKKVKVK